ncbi:MAG TPA: hypothetical protein GXX18_06205 [Bacillales bacterium]|nr:hypothetical protein [Bacillales bacterium]
MKFNTDLPFKYQIVTEKSVFYYNDLEDLLKNSGYVVKGIEQNKNLRPELLDQPKFHNLAGPMWNAYSDGKPCIRYELYQRKGAYDHEV